MIGTEVVLVPDIPSPLNSETLYTTDSNTGVSEFSSEGKTTFVPIVKGSCSKAWKAMILGTDGIILGLADIKALKNFTNPQPCLLTLARLGV